jgi:hypothetical protein
LVGYELVCLSQEGINGPYTLLLTTKEDISFIIEYTNYTLRIPDRITVDCDCSVINGPKNINLKPFWIQKKVNMEFPYTSSSQCPTCNQTTCITVASLALAIFAIMIIIIITTILLIKRRKTKVKNKRRIKL